MRVRAKLTLRNDKMLSARLDLGLTQVHLAKLAGVDTQFVSRMEAMDYSNHSPEMDQRARRVADVLEISIGDVIPNELRGHKIESSVERVAEVDAVRMMSFKRKALPCPVAEVSAEDTRAIAKAAINFVLSQLEERDREIITLRYGLDGGGIRGIDDLGRRFKITQERVRSLEKKALRTMNQLIADSRFRDAIDQ